MKTSLLQVSMKRTSSSLYSGTRSLISKTQQSAPPSAQEPSPKQAEQKAVESLASKAKLTPKKTVAQLDEELRRKMSGLAGDGDEAGVEYEDGKPADMKRSVKNNMFRYI